MRRRHSYARRTIASEFRGFLASNRYRLLTVLILWTSSGALVSLLVQGYLRGLLHGLLAASFLMTVCSVFVLGTGQASRLAGTWGEGNTRDILRWGRRRGHIVDWVDNLEVIGGDVDHLVISSSGLFAIDSKWHGHSVSRETIHLDQSRAESAARRAQGILRSLHIQHEVKPVVVVWGGEQARMGGPSRPAGDTLFLPGRDLKAWLQAQRRGRAIRNVEGREIAAQLRDFKRRVRPK